VLLVVTKRFYWWWRLVRGIHFHLKRAEKNCSCPGQLIAGHLPVTAGAVVGALVFTSVSGLA